MEIPVKEVQVTIVKSSNGLLALCSCTIFDCFYCGSIGLYSSPTTPSGFRITFPTRKLSSGQQVPIFHAFRKEAEQAVTKAITEKYLELMSNFQNV